ncbi:MAG: M64 family metallopeptidase [Marinilabiliales bacterium]|nr:M64 family metallopeptidase [Marinilabiliales bacterium]
MSSVTGLQDWLMSTTHSEVAYEEFYPLDVEPWEPNITTRVNFDAKWKNLIAKSVPVPTPNDKRYTGVTGLFEGGGYSAKGIYRPSFDCRMKSNQAETILRGMPGWRLRR